ncbi:phosphomannomutase/phosphoglucomutase [Halieaceae bacterium IMCC14734]|uniref:phosphomannomutase n=1 Tax=Candidatus Litorirhabdus singularis TaxID=2518993 RepID=A0ABT3TCK0_9GAMM|nr:phosphomannomutase/phosphoglucomutase [Candidatus Litorirhabdus singularis]MCX2980022.1 phosphomannomutase/phosphoglucomutase [Candidatus Litorirhabdus singularis]
MFKKKQDAQPGTAEPIQDIAAHSDVFQKTWLVAMAVMLIPLLLVFAYLLLIRESAVQSQQITLLSETHAEQQSAGIRQFFSRLDKRLKTAAATPLAVSVLDINEPAAITAIEQQMLAYFPGAVSLRLIRLDAMGTAGLADDNQGLRNHIEVDLLRRTAKGEDTAPESYKFEERWLTSLAEQVVNSGTQDASAVLMATIDNTLLSEVLAAAGVDAGRSALLQLYRQGNYERADEIAAAGSGKITDKSATVDLNDGLWQLSFTPSKALVAAYTPATIIPAIMAAIALLALVCGMLLLRLHYRKALTKEVELIVTSARKKGALMLSVPELLPIAKMLRRSLQRPTSQSTNSPGAATPPPKEPTLADGHLAAPMFQNTSMIDEELETLDLDTEPAPEPEPEPVLVDDGIPSHIFRAYDIRGNADEELDDEMVEKIGSALGSLAGEQGQQSVIIACDGRLSSPRIKSALGKALAATGRDVIDIGAVPTPVLYYATHALESRTGIMVTGSHNPIEDNGLKIVMDGKPFAGEKIQALRERISSGDFSTGKGRLLKQDIVADYIDTIVGDMAIAVSLKVVIDAGNGIAGAVAPQLLTELGCEVVPMYCEVDGNFPNHHPDTSDESNLRDLCQRVVAEGADIGVAFDGDGDRLAVVSAEGEIIRTDKLLMIFAQDIVSRNPGADVIFDVKCSRHLIQLVSRYGGRPILWKTGHAFMKEKMQETGALLGGEFSGHIFFGERWFGFDDGMYSACRLAEIISASDQGLTPLLADFPNTQNTPEIKLPVSDADKFNIVSALAEQGNFSPGKINTLDGVRVDYSDGWGLLRASNTGPALTARFEAEDIEGLERIKNQFSEQLKAVANIETKF